MASIQQYGLLHPIVVDDKRRLIAGYRRLEAFKRLGKKRIEVTFYGDLSEKEREKLEWEENERRKNLTPYERSKFTKHRKEKAKKELQEEADDSSQDSCDESKKKKRGGQKKPDSKDAIAEKLGKTRPEIEDSDEHVAAGEKYPFLQGPLWKQKPALEMAKVLDDIGKKDVEYLYTFCGNGAGSRPPQIRAFFETWHAATAATRKKLKRRLDGDRHRSSRAVSLMGKCAPRPDPALLWADEIVRTFNALVKKRATDDAFLSAMKKLQSILKRFQSDAVKYNYASIEELRKELLS